MGWHDEIETHDFGLQKGRRRPVARLPSCPLCKERLRSCREAGLTHPEGSCPFAGFWERDHWIRVAEAIYAKLKAARGKVKSADTKRLDFLDECTKRLNASHNSSYGWKFDMNYNRTSLQLADHHYPAETVRRAIDAEMRRCADSIIADPAGRAKT